MSMNLKGKVVIVTGGNSGIGRATALVFAREGARVVIAARNAERGHQVVEELKSAGAESLFVATDVSKTAEVETLVRKTVERFGRLDCAVNNAAGYMGAFSATADFSEEEFDATADAAAESGGRSNRKRVVGEWIGRRRDGVAILSCQGGSFGTDEIGGAGVRAARDSAERAGRRSFRHADAEP
jgi:NAD(P)-dependent dehydrogenase (short-subunit alcohol dehydrogenase family)